MSITQTRPVTSAFAMSSARRPAPVSASDYMRVDTDAFRGIAPDRLRALLRAEERIGRTLTDQEVAAFIIALGKAFPWHSGEAGAHLDALDTFDLVEVTAENVNQHAPHYEMGQDGSAVAGVLAERYFPAKLPNWLEGNEEVLREISSTVSNIVIDFHGASIHTGGKPGNPLYHWDRPDADFEPFVALLPGVDEVGNIQDIDDERRVFMANHCGVAPQNEPALEMLGEHSMADLRESPSIVELALGLHPNP